MDMFKGWFLAFASKEKAKRSRKRSPKRQRRGVRLERLEARDLLALDIVFDYTYDDADFFTTEARAALDRAASDYEARIEDTLNAIPAPPSGNSWSASFQDPETGATISLNNLQLAEGEVRVFVGARDLPGTTLGKASTGYGLSYQLNTAGENWRAAVQLRGQTGENEHSTWGGSIAFDTTPTWHFGESDPTPGTTDLYSVALHELGHIFGITNQAGNTWTSYLSGNFFTGPKSTELYGGPIPADGGHFEHDVSYAGQEAALDPNLTTGTRKPMSPLDWTALDDIGWTLNTRFLSGTVFNDSVIDNNQPDPGEGESGLTVTATNTSTNIQYTTTTHTDGTYALELPPGTYNITFTGGGYDGQVELSDNDLGTENFVIDVDTGDANWQSSFPTITTEIQFDRDLGLYFSGNYHLNWGGANEKWIFSDTGTWYFIKPSGAVHQWNSGNFNASPWVATFDASVYSDPSSLYSAYDQVATNHSNAAALVPKSTALNLDITSSLKIHSSGTYDNWSGLNERWLHSDSGTWYIIREHGDFYRWNGGSSFTWLARIDAQGYDSVHTVAYAASVTPAIVQLDQTYSLINSTNYWFNWGGLSEKWIRGSSTWFYITPSGNYYQWHGGSVMNRTLLTTVAQEFYVYPDLLTNAFA